MIEVLGALFVIGTALAIFISTWKCGEMDVWRSPQYGAAWAFLPALVFGLTENTYATIVATWIPTIVLVDWTEQTVCEKPAA